MNCVICKNGDTRPGHVTVTLQHGECTVIIKEVPADVCQNCGEHYLSEEISTRLQRKVEEAAGTGDEVTVLLYAA